jgi:uncharacterized DUF497 family protein
MIVYNNFEWDVREAAACLATHGVSFKEASTVFADADVAIAEDPASGHLRAVGKSARGRALVVLFQKGQQRTRILSATLPTSRPAARKAEAAPASAPKPAAPPAAEPAPVSGSRLVASAVEPAAPEVVMEPPTSSNRLPGAGWSAEVYGMYWDAYSAARKAARQQGKSMREAQRLGREAGERAVSGLAETAAK